MKLVSFTTGREERVGLLDADRETIRDVTGLLPDGAGMLEVIERWDELGPALARNASALPARPLADVRLLAPIPRPRRNVWCVGKNYRAHALEVVGTGLDDAGEADAVPERPVVFSKATTAVVGPDAEIDPHRGVTAELDYEGELAVIIGRGGRAIPAERAFDHVWGYTILNDVTARDLQRDHQQWLLGKSLDTHCPMGPWAVTADEVDDVGALELRTAVNGETRQFAPVKDLVFGVDELVATISAGTTLLPGDILATGTPAGVGMGFDPPRYLAPGDVVEVSITGLGILRNRVGGAR
ncbi:MAG TPA: fumarylacetoacetate hydrolase family protein [Pseudonocardia sp.]|jgi:2-keto-4-pentenoate hydratase/2-oxohepta-3-ene-1,7-dioic acid hydratase in catechol pathway|uniref:fumarylacetoacetate hydrolase family protein n=1 Tax=Pseudonocardia sp. TaxID=60912 RepID=UPI002B4AFD22|nr:fumarylacetoacetate hydrolase family protein [Pseudonocardia sp.]HLU58933.1 fumarylacetoacetate hydrolase family protein [Pseudonocardia sp.]